MKDSVKRLYNAEEKIIITEYADYGECDFSIKLQKRDGYYNIVRQLPVDSKTKKYLKQQGIDLQRRYDSVEEIQKIVDMLDGWHFSEMHMPEINNELSYIMVDGVYRYIGEDTAVFSNGREYLCTISNADLFKVIGDDLNEYIVDEEEFVLIKQYHYINPFVRNDAEFVLEEEQLLNEEKVMN